MRDIEFGPDADGVRCYRDGRPEGRGALGEQSGDTTVEQSEGLVNSTRHVDFQDDAGSGELECAHAEDVVHRLAIGNKGMATHSGGV